MTSAAPSPKAELARWGLKPKKRFGQSFLADARLAERIALAATDPSGGTVVEIGAGLGALTRPLLARAARVVAIERDRDLVPVLRAELRAPLLSGQLELVEADAKQVDFVAWLRQGPAPRVLAGNLPYQITGPLLERAVGVASEVARVVFLVQLEVADRLAASPGSASWGALSVFVHAMFEVRRELIVRRGAFYPSPSVDSALVVLEPRAEPLAAETPAFRALVHAAFQQRRKKLRNAWQGVLGADQDNLARAAERAGIDLDARGETLTVGAFGRMARELEA
jgi:16S rRNA (adenine1518-N6/adenine1519-N6)-dimethyltransferase